MRKLKKTLLVNADGTLGSPDTRSLFSWGIIDGFQQWKYDGWGWNGTISMSYVANYPNYRDVAYSPIKYKGGVSSTNYAWGSDEVRYGRTAISWGQSAAVQGRDTALLLAQKYLPLNPVVVRKITVGRDAPEVEIQSVAYYPYPPWYPSHPCTDTWRPVRTFPRIYGLMDGRDYYRSDDWGHGVLAASKNLNGQIRTGDLFETLFRVDEHKKLISDWFHTYDSKTKYWDAATKRTKKEEYKVNGTMFHPLQYLFGIAPTSNALYELACYLAEFSHGITALQNVGRTGIISIKGSRGMEGLPHHSEPGVKPGPRRWKAVLYFSVEYNPPSNAFDSIMEMMRNLHMLPDLLGAWQLLPWSWFVDSIIDISTMLEMRDVSERFNVRLVGGTESYKTKIQYAAPYTHVTFNVSGNTNVVNVPESLKGQYVGFPVVEEVYIRRVIQGGSTLYEVYREAADNAESFFKFPEPMVLVNALLTRFPGFYIIRGSQRK